MSIRSIWILLRPSFAKDEGKSGGYVIFSKCFPTCERRAKIYNEETYVPVPDDQEISDKLLAEIGWSNQSDKFVEKRDTCCHRDQKPVFSIKTKVGNLWPIIVLEQFNMLFCCLPLVEEKISEPFQALIGIPSVSAGFNFLLAIAKFLGPLPKGNNIDELMMNLHLFINQAAPFGTPLFTDTAIVAQILSGKTLVTSLPAMKQPAWKPLLHKGKSSIQITISETLRAVQYDSVNNPNVKEIYGTVSCKAELEGYSHDVTVNLTHQPDGVYVPLENVILHSCVQSSDLQTSVSCSAPMSRRGSLQSPPMNKIRFSPGIDTFQLCHYNMKIKQNVPVIAYYQMKITDDIADLLLQLKLDPKIKNSFEYFEVQLPFYQCGSIVSFEQNTTQGIVNVSGNKHILLWNIGTKFPSKTLEIVLKANVTFSNSDNIQGNLNTEDLFTVGNNAYAKLFFKMTDYTYSGVTIDPKTMQVAPAVKYKFNLTQEVVASDYKVWNSHGDALIAFPAPETPLPPP